MEFVDTSVFVMVTAASAVLTDEGTVERVAYVLQQEPPPVGAAGHVRPGMMMHLGPLSLVCDGPQRWVVGQVLKLAVVQADEIATERTQRAVGAAQSSYLMPGAYGVSR